MSGIELLTTLHSKGSSVKFGFVTSESTPAMHEAAMGAGALFLITKPFTPEKFQDILSEVISS
jgi:two-component system, chemotaxis family, chemotaxis protein CheY